MKRHKPSLAVWGGLPYDERLADLIEGLHPITRGAFEFTYLETARTLARYYRQFANFPDAIRREPSLVPAGLSIT